MKTKIENGNLNKYIGKTVWLFCQVGVMFNVSGKLVRGGLCQYNLELSNGDLIGFSFGNFEIDSDSGIHIYIA